MTPTPTVEAESRELLPCAHCGRDDAIIGCNDHEEPIWYVQCGCTAGVSDQPSEEKALAAWNTRAAPSPATSGEPVAIAWTTENLRNWFPGKTSEVVTKLTAFAQPEHGFTQPLYASPIPIAGPTKEDVEDAIATAKLDAQNTRGSNVLSARERGVLADAVLALFNGAGR